MFIALSPDRRLVEEKGGERFIRIALEAPDPEGAADRPRLPLSLALVLDRSGSMGGRKIRLAKDAISACADHLQDADRLALVAYDDVVDTVLASTAATSAVRADLPNRLAALEARGSTNLCDGWLTGAEQAARATDERMRVLLVSDGLANVGETDPARLTAHARELRARGLSTSTIGIGEDFDEELMRSLAEEGGGNFHYVSEPAEIAPILAGEFGELLAPYADDVRIELGLPAGVRVEALGGLTTDRADGRVRVRLAPLAAGRETDAVFRVIVPAGRLGAEFTIEAVVTWRDARDGAARAVRAGTAVFEIAQARAVAAEKRDETVVQRAVEVAAADARREALAANRRREFDRAASVVARASANLADLARGFGASEELVADLGAFSDRAAAPMSKAALKEEDFGTYRTARRRPDYRKPDEAS